MKSTAISQARTILVQAKTTVSFSGAGLSAESGISTFRDHKTNALWSHFDPTELASPQGFAANPQRVIDWYNWRRSTLAKAQPNPAHMALAQQNDLIQITQNVDDLLERSGLPAKQIYHLHGTITKDHCDRSCGYEETINLEFPPALRSCPNCNHFMRPSAVWFGESLPSAVWSKALHLCNRTNCLIVIGTSAAVFPAAGLIQTAKQCGAKIIVVNTEPSEASGLADIELIGPSGEIIPQLLVGLELHSI